MVASDHSPVIAEVRSYISTIRARTEENLAWLQARMHPYFFFCNSEDIEAVAVLATDLHLLEHNQRFTLADSEKSIIIAQLGVPGALYKALRSLPEKGISYAQMHTSYGPVLKTDFPLEVLEFSFDCTGERPLAPEIGVEEIPAELGRAVQAEVVARYPDFQADEVAALLGSFMGQQ